MDPKIKSIEVVVPKLITTLKLLYALGFPVPKDPKDLAAQRFMRDVMKYPTSEPNTKFPYEFWPKVSTLTEGDPRTLMISESSSATYFNESDRTFGKEVVFRIAGNEAEEFDCLSLSVLSNTFIEKGRAHTVMRVSAINSGLDFPNDGEWFAETVMNRIAEALEVELPENLETLEAVKADPAASSPPVARTDLRWLRKGYRDGIVFRLAD